MIQFKKEIAKEISTATEIEQNEIEGYIEIPKDQNNGDYAFPCFRLAKTLKKAPQAIAEEIKEKIEIDNNVVEKIEVLGGYINFYINKKVLAKEVLEEIANKEEYGKAEIGKGKNIVIDYSSPNIAKPFHIGHLRTTLIGNSLYRIYKYLGYNTTGVNHLGDYGTQFGKMIEAYKMWGQEYDLTVDPINKLMDMYVRMYDELKRSSDDNPTIGIILCSDTDEDIARYSVLKENEHLFATKYKLYLPTQEELKAEIEKQKTLFLLQQTENGQKRPNL